MDSWTDNLARAVEASVATDNRHETTIAAPIPDEPVLFVANHSFGGVFDLNVIAFAIGVASQTLVGTKWPAGVPRPSALEVQQLPRLRSAVG